MPAESTLRHPPRRVALTDQPLWILTVLVLCVVASEALARLPLLRHLGAALLVIVVTALAANLGVIPTGEQETHGVYAAVFDPLVQLAIFLLLLQVDLVSIAKAGAPMLTAFGLGALGTLGGVLAGLAVAGGGLGPLSAELGGMFVGTYTGGSVNFNAVAVEYRVPEQDGLLYTGAVAVDSIMTAVWMVVTLLVPGARRRAGAGADAPASPASDGGGSPAATGTGRAGDVGTPAAAAVTTEGRAGAVARTDGDAEDQAGDRSAGPLAALDVALALAVACLALLASRAIADGLATLGVEVPSMLVLTTLALILAQLPAGRALRAAKPLGMLGVMVFLAVIGAWCDIGALAQLRELGRTLFVFTSVLLTVHGLVLFGLGRLLRLDRAVCAVASQANIGGGTTALAVARSLGRGDLAVPGLLVGSLGTAVGTFLGFELVRWLR